MRYTVTSGARILPCLWACLGAPLMAADGGPDTAGMIRIPAAPSSGQGAASPDLYLDATPVTVAAFRRFVEQAAYVPQSDRFGDSGVMPLTDPGAVDVRGSGWMLAVGANWAFPLGEGYPPARDDHPVTHIAWYDARAYCGHQGKRLPTEAEWARAARAGGSGPYAGIASLTDDRGQALANTWEPLHGEKPADGYVFTSPVGHYPPNALGLFDMVGNVWEWTATPYDAAQAGQSVPAILAQRDNGYDTPLRSGDGAAGEYVLKGGSFLCHRDSCHGFRTDSLNHASPETSLMHFGFRCAADVSR